MAGIYNLGEILKQRGLSMDELSTMTGITKSTLYGIVTRQSCTSNNLQRIAKALNVDVSALKPSSDTTNIININRTGNISGNDTNISIGDAESRILRAQVDECQRTIVAKDMLIAELRASIQQLNEQITQKDAMLSKLINNLTK